MAITYGKRKRASAIFKKYTSKKAKMSAPMRYFEQKSNIFGAGVATTTTGSVVRLVDLAAGTGRDERQGNKVTYNSMDIKYKWVANTGGASSQLCRVLIFCDLQQSLASTPTIANVLETDILSGLALDRRDRFKVLYDKTLYTTLTGENSRYIEASPKFNITSEWASAASTNIAKNGIYMILLSDSAASGPSISYNIRMNFTDW